MSNLLPTQQKADLVFRVRMHMGIVLFGLIAVSGLIVLASLMPSYVVMRAAASAVTETRAASSTDQTVTIAEAQALLSQLAVAVSTTSPAQLAVESIAARPAGVVISHVTYTRGTPSTLVITGTASRRDDVNAYRATLASNPRFQAVTVPINALVGADDGAFTITASGTF